MRGSTGQLEQPSNPFIGCRNEVCYGRRPIRTIRSVRFLAVMLLLIPSSLSAQAWLFPKGEGTVAISYQDIYIRNHAFSKGEVIDRGHSLAHNVNVDVDYSLTRNLAVRIAVPYVIARYKGPRPHPTANDDGAYHGTLQDYTFDLRYNVSRGPIVFTPFVSAVIPSHGYEYFAHAAPGRDLHEYHVGTNLGRRLDPILPDAYIQARYSYAFVPRILGISPNRSDAEVQVGYFVKPDFSVLGMVQGIYTHSGLNYRPDLPLGGVNEQQYRVHDQIGRDNLLDVGGGTVFALSPTVEVFVSAARSVVGRNSHLHASVVTFGFSRSFGSGLKAKDASSWAGGPAPRKALVCTCARTR
jgi:hypothetical protein